MNSESINFLLSVDRFVVSVGLKGNGTCAISTRVPMVENLETHPDYDVYLKKQQGSPWCDADRLYNGDFTQKNGSRLTKHEKSNKNKSVTDNGGSFPKLIEPVSTPLHTPSLPRYILCKHIYEYTHTCAQ